MIQQSAPSFNPPPLKSKSKRTIPARILDYLIGARGQRVTVEELVLHVLGYLDGADPYNRALLHVHMSYLRRSLPAGVTVRYRREPGFEGYELTIH